MDAEKDVVVLVHGLGGSRIDMWPIASRLKRLGYDVRILGYRILGYRRLGNRVETHALRLGTELTTLDGQMSGGQLHLVTHSMGGIIAGTMFADFEFHNLGRVVMLAPPHRGSHMARKLTPLVSCLSPSVEQLSDSADSFVNRLPNTLKQKEIEFGIIESPKDRVIEQGGVHLEGHRDYARVEGHHGVLTGSAVRFCCLSRCFSFCPSPARWFGSNGRNAANPCQAGLGRILPPIVCRQLSCTDLCG